jgi:tryptophan-rich sensory protein
MVLNAIWTPIFFAGYPTWGASAFWQGAVIIVAMDVITWLTIVQFKRVDVTAARLLIPYEAWLWIATSLNIYLWLNN